MTHTMMSQMVAELVALIERSEEETLLLALTDPGGLHEYRGPARRAEAIVAKYGYATVEDAIHDVHARLAVKYTSLYTFDSLLS